MKHFKVKTLATLLSGLLLAGQIARADEVIAFQESFETDGNGSRYVIEGAGDNGQLAFFQRRELGSTGVEASGGSTDGSWIFGASDLDGMPGSRIEGYPDLTNRKGRLRFDNIPVAGLGNLRFVMAAAVGEGTHEADNPLYISVRFDDGDWVDIGGFKSSSSNTPPKYFIGSSGTVTTKDMDGLLSYFVDWDWDIIGNGSSLDIAILIDSNYYEEDFFLDNIRVIGESGVSVVEATFGQSEVVEPISGAMNNTLTLRLDSPAPAGGVSFSVKGTREGMNSVVFPDTFAIPAGQTTGVFPVQVVQDGGFTATEVDDFQFLAEGYNTSMARMTIENSTPEPTKLVIMEIHNATPGDTAEDLQGDANNDGRRHTSDDQFIEIVNFENYAIDITGWTIGEELGDRHIFPEGTVLQPNTAVVVFGGGEPKGAFSGALVQVSSTGGNGLGYDRSSGPDDAFIAAPFGYRLEDIDMPQLAAIRAITSSLPWDNPAYDQGSPIHRTQSSRDSEFEIHPMIASANYTLFSPGGWPDGTPYFTPQNTLTIALSQDTISESDGENVVTATVSIASPAPAGGFEFTIDTDGVIENEDGSLTPDEIALDTLSYVIPAGGTSLSFPIDAHNDEVLDGDRDISLIARAGAYVLPAYANLTVTDVAQDDLDVVINEVMVDVVDVGADINLDGIEDDAGGDQFVEIVNMSGRTVDFSGWELAWNDGTVFGVPTHMHTFPEGTRVPNESAIVVFGSITEEAAMNPVFKNAIVQQATKQDGTRKFGGIGLVIGRDAHISLNNQYGYEVATFVYTDDMSEQNQSITREPDITGQPDLHFEVSWVFLQFSPGRMSDDSPFPGNGAAPTN